MLRPQGLSALILTTLILAGCVVGPAYPLMTPIQVGQSFGYSETATADGKWEIAYVTPTASAPGFHFDTSPADAQAKTLATDMILWRAAEVAQSQGFRGFGVIDKHWTTDATNVSGYSEGPYWHAWGWHHHWWGEDPWFDEPPHQYVQVQGKFVIHLTNTLQTGDMDAAQTIDQMRRAYPGAELSPPPPPAAPAKPTA